VAGQGSRRGPSKAVSEAGDEADDVAGIQRVPARALDRQLVVEEMPAYDGLVLGEEHQEAGVERRGGMRGGQGYGHDRPALIGMAGSPGHLRRRSREEYGSSHT